MAQRAVNLWPAGEKLNRTAGPVEADEVGPPGLRPLELAAEDDGVTGSDVEVADRGLMHCRGEFLALDEVAGEPVDVGE